MQRENPGRQSARNALRRATAEVHERLHAAVPFAGIADRRLGLDGYSALLGKIAAFHFQAGRDIPGQEGRRALIRQDLDTLGIAAEPARLTSSFPQTDAARLGCAYVIEGSALGGKVVYRQLDYLFGEVAAGRRFFLGSPSDGSRWRSLCERLEAGACDENSLAEMIGGALRTFALFEDLIAPVPANG